MVVGNPRDNSVCFADFCADFDARQLDRNGTRVPLQGQPFHILEILLRKPGAIVSRQTLAEEIWPSGTFVDFEHSLNTAVKKLRKALDDDPDDPKYIETVPRYGYRFIGTILQPKPARAVPVEVVPEPVPVWHQRRVVLPAYLRQFTKLDIAALSAALIVLVVAAAWRQPEWYKTRASGKPINSIAILPLQNSTGDPNEEYLADGMTDALIADVSQFHGLSVVSHSSVDRYKSSGKSVKQIMRELNVDAIVSGSLTQSNGVVGLSAEILRSGGDSPLWSGKYEGKLGNLLRLQDDVTLAIGRQIHVALPSAAVSRTGKGPSRDSAAYEPYLRGRYFLEKRSVSDLDKAEHYFDQAVVADSDFAPAYAGLSEDYTLEIFYGMSSRLEGAEKARAAAQKALQLDDALPEAHAALAGVDAVYFWNWGEAEREFQRALQLNPSYAPAHHWYAVLCLAPLGRLDEAQVEIQRAHELDPLSAIVETDLGFVYSLRSQFPEAKEAYEQALEIDPDFVPAHFRLGELDIVLGKYDDAHREELINHRLTGPSPTESEDKFREAEKAYQASGYNAYVRTRISATKGDQNDYYAAYNYIYLREPQLAIKRLMAAAEDRDPGMIYVAVDPALKSLHKEQAFQDIVRRMGLPLN